MGQSRCRCESADSPTDQFSSVYIGCDETAGRYADVSLLRCEICGRDWLNYSVNYEGFRKSGRWARGLVDLSTGIKLNPAQVVDHLNGLDWYLYGGSYFDGQSGQRRGPMHWGV